MIQESYIHLFQINALVVSLLEISPKNHIFLKQFKSGFHSIRVWFTDQNNQTLEVEDFK